MVGDGNTVNAVFPSMTKVHAPGVKPNPKY